MIMSEKHVWLVVLLLILVTKVLGSSKLCVSPEKSSNCSDEIDCHECHSLEEYSTIAQYISLIRSNSVLQFLSGSHHLNTTLHVEGKSNVSLLGCDQNVIIKCTGEYSGVTFKHSYETKLTNLQFIGCGTAIPYRHYRDRASLIIIRGANLSLINITIVNAVDAGILLISINETTFISRLNVSNTISTANQTRGNEIAYYTGSTNYKLVLQDSTFVNNNFHNNESRREIQVSGLTIRVTSCYASILVTRSEFRNNKGMSKGGNLAINMEDILDNSKENVTLINLLIEGGNAPSGGGLYIFITKSSLQAEGNTRYIVIENVTFTRNKAKHLGAALYTQLKGGSQQKVKVHILLIKNCTFSSNHLTKSREGGIAIHNNYFDIDSYLPQFSPQYKIILHNCYFQQHSILNMNNTEGSGGNSVIFINTHDYFEIANITITNNKVNALTAANSNLILKGNITLSNNSGSSGGGMLLCQEATIYLTPNTSMSIYNNEVNHTGGGICVEPRCLIERPKCFFQVDNEIKLHPRLLETIKIDIHNNTAKYGGDDIYGGDVDFCYMIDSPKENRAPNNSLEVYYKIFRVSNETVTSPPRQVCFCNNGGIDCNSTEKNISSYPGEVFKVELVLVGQLNGMVPGVVQTWMQGKENITIQPEVNNITGKCTPLKYIVNADPSRVSRAHFKIGVQHTEDRSGYERLKNTRKKDLYVNLKPCPLGFRLDTGGEDTSGEDTTCVCNLISDDLECHVKKKVLMKRKKDANTWIGFEYANDTTHGMPTAIKYNENCPFDYCIKKELKLNLNASVYKKDKICANNRAGVMCGSCKEGHSTVLGSSKCEKCSNKHLILLVGFSFAGLILVIALTLLNLTIAEGTLSSLIFYANIIECNSSFIVPSSEYYSFPTPILRVFIAWINLDLGITTCFFNGMDEYAEAWLQFAFPLYIWSIAAVIILLSNKFQVVARIASRNAVKVLATLVLLSYATFTHAVISTFSFSRVHTLAEDNTTASEAVWLVDGNMAYFGLKHTLLFAVALFFGLLTLPFTIALLFIKQMQRFSHKKAFRWVETLKPFLDAFTGPYTDSGRFWPGLLLLARICLSLSGGLNILSAHRVIEGATSLVIIILLSTAALVRPGLYTLQALDALEYFFLLNLTVLFLGSTYYDGYGYKQKVVFDSTVGLAFVAFIIIVLYHLLLKIKQYAFCRNVILWLKAKLESFRDSMRRENRAHIMRNFPPYNTFTEDREPLLSDHED